MLFIVGANNRHISASGFKRLIFWHLHVVTPSKDVV